MNHQKETGKNRWLHRCPNGRKESLVKATLTRLAPPCRPPGHLAHASSRRRIDRSSPHTLLPRQSDSPPPGPLVGLCLKQKLKVVAGSITPARQLPVP